MLKMHRLSLTSPILSTYNFETPVARMSVPPLLGFLLKEKLLKALLPVCEQLFWPLPNYWMIWCLEMDRKIFEIFVSLDQYKDMYHVILPY